MKKHKPHPHPASNTAGKQQHRSDAFSSSDEPGFSFLAGYTSWGFPYGTLAEDEMESSPTEDEDLPF